MNIAVIGWGSLIWKPEGKEPPDTALLIHKPWSADGPLLPVEFARQSSGSRLTLVICEGPQPQRTLWARSQYGDLPSAIVNLTKREGTGKKHIHFVEKSSASRSEEDFDVDIVREWLAGRDDLDAAIWTGLPPKFSDQERVPTPDEAVSFLQGLSGVDMECARDYLRRTPESIRTEIRSKAEEILGWDPIPLPPGTVCD